MALTHSSKVDKIAAALVNVQSLLKPAAHDATRDGRTYATLDAVVMACRGLMLANGIAVSQSPTKGGVATMLLHTSGQWLKDDGFELASRLDRDDELSAITIARKYALASFCGVTWAEEPAREQHQAIVPTPFPAMLELVNMLKLAARAGTAALTAEFNALTREARTAIVSQPMLWQELKAIAEVVDVENGQ